MIRVTCAIIRNEDNEVLVVQRGGNTDHPFKWEFPGGKIDFDETEEECILREIREELSIDIVICGRLENVEYDYGKKQIALIPFICDTLDDLPVLNVHIAFKWLESGYLVNLDLAEADVIVAENYLKYTNYEAPASDPEYEDSGADEEEFKSMINATMGAKEVEWIAASAVENPAIFRRLFKYSMSDDRKLAFHSSWALTKISDKYPDLFNPVLPGIIDMLDKLDNESTQRSFLRILTFADFSRLTGKQHGILAEHCFAALRSGFSAIAIKAYSMEIIFKLAVIYPELAHELAATINMLESDSSAGIIARGRIILKKLAEMPAGRGSTPSLS